MSGPLSQRARLDDSVSFVLFVAEVAADAVGVDVDQAEEVADQVLFVDRLFLTGPADDVQVLGPAFELVQDRVEQGPDFPGGPLQEAELVATELDPEPDPEHVLDPPGPKESG